MSFFRRIVQFFPRSLANRDLKRIFYMKHFIKALLHPETLIFV